MIRTQIQLTREQSEALQQASRRTGLSMAELIRRSVDRFLDEVGSRDLSDRQERGRLSALQVVGRFHSDVTDVSLRHDDYLDGVYLPEGACLPNESRLSDEPHLSNIPRLSDEPHPSEKP